MPSSKGSSHPGIEPMSLTVSCIGRPHSLPLAPPGKTHCNPKCLQTHQTLSSSGQKAPYFLFWIVVYLPKHLL